MPLRFVLDDIAESECDAVIYAATPEALAAGAAPAPGTEPEEEREIFANLGEDEARITFGNDLYCTYVIHVPDPVWAGDGADAARLAHCYDVCLGLARDHDCRSAAFPLIGAGRYGFPEDEALRTAVKSLSDSPLEVELVFDDKAAFDRAGEQYPELV